MEGTSAPTAHTSIQLPVVALYPVQDHQLQMSSKRVTLRLTEVSSESLFLGIRKLALKGIPPLL